MSILLINKSNRVATLTLNRPEKRNALNPALINSLSVALAELKEDNAIKVVVIKGAGSVFCSGADLAYIKQLQKNTFEDNLKDSTNLAELYFDLFTYPKITIAQTQGFAVAGGAGLSTVCDFTISTDDCQYGYPEVKIGFVPAMVSVFLKRKISGNHALDLLLSGRLISASEALEIGLIHKSFSHEEIDTEVNDFAINLCTTTSRSSIALTKKALFDSQIKLIKAELNKASEINAHSRESEDCKKGVQNFLDKKKLEW